ncbi:4Fe-4S binding protein [Bacteroidales bacterium]|nr:4Fe-4S binding protein [Bacteroidales bacterium]
MALSKIVDINKDKCTNCHQCISVCPCKFANDGTEDEVRVNHDLCIGCGQCVKACTHNARIIVDDFDDAFNALKSKEKLIAFVAPAIAANFPGKYLKINAWLRSLGVDAIFDVSFGAELTVKSYIEHIKNTSVKTIISQPCPAIVTYLQLYKPELLKYLAPADSPMLHTVKMVKEFHPEYKDHKCMIISPCTAKRREFDETGLVDYNVTFSKINDFLKEQNINLDNFKETGFNNDPAERAVLFSSPGGLLETAEREIPGIRRKTRKIEGPEVVYKYFENLEESINNGTAPLIVDCLNCHAGCNGGTGTDVADLNIDELEYRVNTRCDKNIDRYKNENKTLSTIINKYWKPELYSRKYKNLNYSYLESIKEPNEAELDATLKQMHKFNDEDLINCASCGYNSCTEMAKAIFNNLNKKENCFEFNQKEVEEQNKELDKKVLENNQLIENQNTEITKQKTHVIEESEQLLKFLGEIRQLIK